MYRIGQQPKKEDKKMQDLNEIISKESSRQSSRNIDWTNDSFTPSSR